MTKGTDHEDHIRRRIHPQARRIPHAGRIRAAGLHLDAVAPPPRQLARRREACPACLQGGRAGHRAVRARHGGREPRRLRGGALRAGRSGQRARRRDDVRRRVDPRLRPDLRRQRRRRRARRALALQQLGRAGGRPVLPVGSGRACRREGGRPGRGRPLPSRRVRAGRRLHPRGRRRHRHDDGDVPSVRRPQPRGSRARTSKATSRNT